MALIADIPLAGGITVEGAYHRIERVELYSPRSGGSMSVEVAAYKDAATRNADESSPVACITYAIPVPPTRDVNIMEYAYNELKQLSSYEGALDA